MEETVSIPGRMAAIGAVVVAEQRVEAHGLTEDESWDDLAALHAIRRQESQPSVGVPAELAREVVTAALAEHVGHIRSALDQFGREPNRRAWRSVVSSLRGMPEECAAALALPDPAERPVDAL